MPTAKPRITITLTEQQHQTLSRLSELQGVSMSSIVVDFLDSVLPVLERVTVVLQQAKDAPDSVRKQLRETAEQAEREMLPHAAEVMEQLNMMVGLAGSDASKPRAAASGSAKKTASAKAKPHSTNRGVRNPQRKSPKPSTGAASKAVKRGAKK